MSLMRRYGAAAAIVVVLIVVLVLPLFLADPLRQDFAKANLGIGADGHILGTDKYGRDFAARLFGGARTELTIAVGAALLSALLGVSLGLVAGYFRGWADFVAMRSVDVLLSFPPIVLAVLVVATYGAGRVTLIVVLGLLFVPSFARLTYGQVLVIRQLEFVDASRIFGSSDLRIMTRVVLPSAAPALIVQASVVLAEGILIGSGMSFLGLGVVPPAPSLGVILSEAQAYMATRPSLILLPASLVVAITLAFLLLANFIQHATDPRRR